MIDREKSDDESDTGEYAGPRITGKKVHKKRRAKLRVRRPKRAKKARKTRRRR